MIALGEFRRQLQLRCIELDAQARAFIRPNLALAEIKNFRQIINRVRFIQPCHLHHYGAGERRANVRDGGFADRTSEVRCQSHIMRFAHRGELGVFGDAAAIRNRDAIVIN